MNTIPQDNLRYKYYVYTLSKPDGTIFYVGKGRGNRILQHENEARRGVKSTKCDIIREIWANGGGPAKTKNCAIVKNIYRRYKLRYSIQTTKATPTHMGKGRKRL